MSAKNGGGKTTVQCQFVNPDGSLGGHFNVQQQDGEAVRGYAVDPDADDALLVELDRLLANWE